MGTSSSSLQHADDSSTQSPLNMKSEFKPATVSPISSHEGSKFEDMSLECGICLEPYSEDPNKEVVQLGCGHKWHLDCVKEQLQHARPNHAQRLVFTGCRCAKCGTVCEHAALDHITRPTDALRVKVDQMILEQLKIEGNTNYVDETMMDEGRRAYAFYLCSSCNEPYFGGTVDCADQLEGERPSQDRLCPSCTPQIVCENPSEHRGAFTWNRYQQHRHNHSNSRASIQAIPCPGGDSCPYLKPPGRTEHQNGSSVSCEQVYECCTCQSVSSRRAQVSTEEPGSANLLINPCGLEGLNGWQQINRHAPWQVESSDLPVHPSRPKNFVSSFSWCVMMQRVDLRRFVQNPSSVRMEVSAKYSARTDCPSVFVLEAVVVDQRGRVLYRDKTPQLNAPADCWERVSIILPATQGACNVVVVVKGKDSRFWAGYYGSKVTDISLRILGSDLDQVML